MLQIVFEAAGKLAKDLGKWDVSWVPENWPPKTNRVKGRMKQFPIASRVFEEFADSDSELFQN